MTVSELVQRAKTQNWKICIYGLGFLGMRLNGYYTNLYGLKTDYYSDGSRVAVDNCTVSGAKGLYKEELLQLKEDILVFVLVDYPVSREITDTLSCNSNLHIVTLHDLIKDDFVQKNFYGNELFDRIMKNQRMESQESPSCNSDKPKVPENKRVAVYTCITGNYDQINHPEYTEDNCDYYVISDNPLHDGVYKWIDVNSLVPDINMSNKEKNRYCKMHPAEIFPEYDYSIYADGSITFIGGMRKYLQQTGKTGLAIHRHRVRECIFQEAIMVVWLGMIDKTQSIQTMKKYAENGMPGNYGLYECCMIVTDLHNKYAKNIMHEWFEEFMAGAQRDQLSLTYVMWKNGFDYSDTGLILDSGDVLDNTSVIWNRGKTHSNDVKAYEGN